MPTPFFRLPAFGIASLCGFFLNATTSQAILIDTQALAHSLISPFGEFGVSTYGQTVTVPLNETVLESFSFKLDRCFNLVTFAAYVAAWDGAKATGPILYSSEARQTGSTGHAEEFKFTTGGLPLAPGSQYVLILSASNFFNGVQDISSLVISNFESYPGGNLVSLQNGSDFALLTDRRWTVFPYDAGFTADFSSSVPEPTQSLVGICLLSVASISRRRQRGKN
ncbi:MAG: repeat-containing protein [Chthoniobacteraceae bacterium]|nr:repeat-containing protein [Chthoniobacteraceae bacterium]